MRLDHYINYDLVLVPYSFSYLKTTIVNRDFSNKIHKLGIHFIYYLNDFIPKLIESLAIIDPNLLNQRNW